MEPDFPRSRWILEMTRAPLCLLNALQKYCLKYMLPFRFNTFVIIFHFSNFFKLLLELFDGPLYFNYKLAEIGMHRDEDLKALDFIATAIKSSGRAPSYREIAGAVGGRTGTGAVHCIVRRLEANGFIRRLPYRPRAIQLIRMPKSAAGIAVQGGA
jgi:hypothetical protein